MMTKKREKREYNILAVSDNEVLKKFTVNQLKEQFGYVDFIISAGDHSYEYLDYLVSVLDKELIYIHGNHVYSKYHDISFCKNIDGKFIKYKDLYIMGFDGSKVYSKKEHQYTEKQMNKRIKKHYFKMLLKKPDIVVSHAPPMDIHDVKDVVHEGFSSFVDLINFAKPKLWLHGHVHLSNHYEVQETYVGTTRVLNVYGYKVINITV
ncbi:MAG: serine/threonine protein phosphatase [Fusobacteria bacterium]|nr:serine/threonine protein phosphatase [Fusobacteriota bacterium]